MPRYIQTVCDCGCSKLLIPYHLRDADLWVRVQLRRGQQTVRFTVVRETAPGNRGWEETA